jgi:hypothetical protein
MKTHEVMRDAVQLYLGCPINLHGIQLLVKRAAGKVQKATEKLWGKLTLVNQLKVTTRVQPCLAQPHHR